MGLRAKLCSCWGEEGAVPSPRHIFRPDFGSEPPDAERKDTGWCPEAAFLVTQSQNTQDGRWQFSTRVTSWGRGS